MIEEIELVKAENQHLKNIIIDLTRQRDALNRICVERSNANRGIYPKKQHTGYCFLTSQMHDITIKYKDDYCNWNTKKCVIFETVFQTPYSLDYGYTEANKLISHDFCEGKADMTTLLGFTCNAYDLKIEDIFANSIKYDGDIAFNLRLRRNGRDNMWEVCINHFNQIESIPAELRFPIKRKEKKHEKEI